MFVNRQFQLAFGIELWPYRVSLSESPSTLKYCLCYYLKDLKERTQFLTYSILNKQNKNFMLLSYCGSSLFTKIILQYILLSIKTCFFYS